jgi:formylglycine-generating enzyme required for sulfatase activity
MYVDLPTATDDDPVAIEAVAEDLPDWLSIHIPEQLLPAVLNEIRVTAASLTEDRTAQVSFSVRAGDWHESRTVTVTGLAARPQPLPGGFAAAEGTARITSHADQLIFHQEIVRLLPSGVTVAFVFVDPWEHDTGAARIVTPFYIQKTEVSNRMFADYLQSLTPSAAREQIEAEWRQGTVNGDGVDAATALELPAVRISPLTAHRFAVWLGGSDGHLPSVDQWDTATGLHQFRTATDRAGSKFPEGPFQGNWNAESGDISVGRRTRGPAAVGSSGADVNPFGGLDFSGNVREMTETMMNGARLSELTGAPVANPLLRVVLRGRSYLNEAPLKWEDLEEQTELPDALGFDETDSSVGFRVVLEMPR